MRVGFGAAQASALEADGFIAAAGDQMQRLLRAGPDTHFATFNAVYERYFPEIRAIAHLYVHSLLAGTVRP